MLEDWLRSEAEKTFADYLKTTAIVAKHRARLEAIDGQLEQCGLRRITGKRRRWLLEAMNKPQADVSGAEWQGLGKEIAAALGESE